jgi:AcrR family transcriptional regulator
MPLPRFEKLPQEKQERILEAAAKVFTTHGYDKASLNLMLEEAGISKGAAYYYFADKADLVATVVRHYWLSSLVARETALDELTRDGFWQAVAGLYLHPFMDAETRPWLLGLSRAVWELPRDMLRSEPLRSVAEEAADWMAGLLRRGRELGLVREDLPDDLLVELIWTLDGVHDRWLGTHWRSMEQAERDRITDVFVSFLQKILAPPASGEEAA